jgi:hypothetical protein
VNSPSNTKRFLFWIILTAVFHGVLCQLLATVLNVADVTLERHYYWSLLVWLPLVQGAAMALVPALTVGLILGHKRGIYSPLVTIPLGVIAFWAYQWWFWRLPWFAEVQYLYVPCILLSAYSARWAYRVAARREPEQAFTTRETTQELVPLGNRWKWVTVIVFVTVLLADAYRYAPLLADDAFISLRYAGRLLEGHGLTWTDGEAVEGYSNLLWILATASLGALGIDLIVAVRILGCACMAAVIIAVGIFYSRRARFDLGVVVGLLFFSCALPITVWTVAGLEQPLLVVALAGAIFAYWSAIDGQYKNRMIAIVLGTFLGVLCLTRPDGPLFTVALVAAFLLGAILKCHRWSWPFLLTFTLIPLACYAGQLAFRLSYYHEWVPNTALVKIAFTRHRMVTGWQYVRDGLLLLAPFSPMAALCMVLGIADRKTRARFLSLITTALFWAAYVICIGGDYMGAYRHLTPIIVLLMLSLVEGTPLVFAVVAREFKHPRAVAACGVLCLSCWYVYGQITEEQQRYLRWAPWEQTAILVAQDLKQAFADRQPLMAVSAAGILPYVTGFPALDMQGVTDSYITHHRTYAIGNDVTGHELGNGAYVLRRQPDLIVWSLGSGPAYRSGLEMDVIPEFRQQYAGVRMRKRLAPNAYWGEDPISLIWVWRDSEKIGIRVSANRIVIPAYFFATEPVDAPRWENHLAAFFAAEVTEAFPYGNRLVVAVDAKHPVEMCLAGVKVGDWKAEVHGQDPDAIQCQVKPSKEGVQIQLTTQVTTPVIVDEVILRR